MDNPKVFISYAWTSSEHEAWVLSLSERLMANGIDVIIDKWCLSPGQDKYAFMEKMIADPSIIHVLMIINRIYKEKADTKTGGVGTEAQIVSSELYEKIDQTKFIPIISETNENGEPYAPIFLKNRIYIDLSAESKFEDEYEKLLRLIYKRPQYIKPALGTPPSFLDDDNNGLSSDVKNSTRQILRTYENRKICAKSIIYEYGNKIINELNKHWLKNDTGNSIDFGKILFEEIQKMKDIRDCLLQVVYNIILNHDVNAYHAISDTIYSSIDRFFHPKGNGQYYVDEFDHFAFFFQEVILHSTAFAIREEAYEILKSIIQRPIIKESENDFYITSIDQRMIFVSDLFYPIYSIGKYYNSITGKNYYSPIVEIMKQRIYGEFNLGDLVEADMFIHYTSVINEEKKYHFPLFAIYSGASKMGIIVNLIYKDHLKNMLPIFGTDSKENLITRIKNTKFPYDSAYIGDYQKIPKLFNFIPENKIGII